MLKVVSGAQTGADVAGLWAAKKFGIHTGGWAPKGFMTLNGNHPEMAETFGIKEHTRGYRGRTIDNLKSADLTIIVVGVMSAGSKLTIDQCKQLNKPHIVIRVDPSDVTTSLQTPKLEEILSHIRRADLLDQDFVLNIAGNSSNNFPRSFEFTFKFCHRLFTALGYTSTVLPSDYMKLQDIWHEKSI